MPITKPLTISAGLHFHDGPFRGNKVTTGFITPNGKRQECQLRTNGQRVGTIVISGPIKGDGSQSRHHGATAKISDKIKVKVRSTDGDSCNLWVGPRIHVVHLKEKIEDELGTSSEDQVLKFKGHVLENGCSLEDYGVEHGDKITLMIQDYSVFQEEESEEEDEDYFQEEASYHTFADKIKVEVRSTNGDSCVLFVKPRIHVEHLKEKIENEIGTSPDDQVLKFKGQVLEIGCPLQDYCVGHGDRITLMIQADYGEEFDITVKDKETGELYDLYIERDSTVRFLKKIIGNKTGVSPRRQVLQHGWLDMDDDDATMDDYGVTQDSRIYLTY